MSTSQMGTRRHGDMETRRHGAWRHGAADNLLEMASQRYTDANANANANANASECQIQMYCKYRCNANTDAMQIHMQYKYNAKLYQPMSTSNWEHGNIANRDVELLMQTLHQKQNINFS